MSRAVSKRLQILLGDLDDEQRPPVTHLDGPVLVLAGAGSGKTRVLTYRIAYLIVSEVAKPDQILAVTFTNKAAGEMKQRVEALVPGVANQIWVATFHSAFARILRREGDRIGLPRNFTIYDEEDQRRLLRECIDVLGLPPKQYSPAAVSSQISRAKSALVMPDQFAAVASNDYEVNVAAIYREYQARLQGSNAADFDDLLIKPIELFQRAPLILDNYQERFRYLLVDEYQDTNRAQYQVLKLLADKYRNVCVVGDDDQSIYRWRGADIRNILDFENDYPDCEVYRLERNYRSTKTILTAANSVIANNLGRKSKTLWTDADDGEAVTVLETVSDIEECQAVVRKIEEQFQRRNRNFKDFAILYRTNTQSRVLEDGLRREGISYVIVGGVRFYERKEIKDVLAYLRLICNHRDTASLMRIINYPSRGIGDVTLEKLENLAGLLGISLFEAMGRADQAEGLSASMQGRIKRFHSLITKYTDLKSEMSAAELTGALVDELGILRIFKEEGTEESLGRAANVRELLNAIMDFSREHRGSTIDNFLEQVALLTDIDTWNDRSNAVTLMTLHSAKGLEFPVVFIVGLEEGLFPISRSFDSIDELEEERRLFYVGATRAKERLFLSWAARRRRMGEMLEGISSRFLKELDGSCVTYEHARVATWGRYDDRGRGRARRRGRQVGDERRRVMPDYEDESQEVVMLAPGCRVRHPTFGTGTTIAVAKTSSGTKATIAFDNVGTKKIMLEYTNMELIS